jgi:hypothetical protein
VDSSAREPAEPQRFPPAAVSCEDGGVIPHLAEAYADKVIKDALERFVPIALIALAFGVVYWLYRRGVVARETAKRKEWLKDRREKRVGAKPTPPEA